MYEYFCKAPLLRKSYSLKFLVVAFLGIHVPLIGFFIYIVYGGSNISPLSSLLVVLALTLVGTLVTLFIINRLLEPVRQASRALSRYLDDKQLPNLTTTGTDEVGQLMSNLQDTIYDLDTLLKNNTDLISLLSHDIRAPTATAIQVCDALGMVDDKDQRQEMLSAFSANLEKQLEFTDNILLLLETESMDERAPGEDSVPLGTLLSEQVDALRGQANEKSITLDYTPPGRDYVVTGHKAFLAHAVGNLIGNAIKFSHPGGRITLRFDERSDGLSLHVEDQGIGFDDTTRETLFERFNARGRGGTGGEKSTGFGLYITRKILENQGHGIDASSPGPGLGARFEVEWNGYRA
ncbi:MAG: sensor histidine kinase [Gammaproteobacteria bacterium]